MTVGDTLLGVATRVDYWHGVGATQRPAVVCRDCGTAHGGLLCVGDDFVCRCCSGDHDERCGHLTTGLGRR